MMNGFGLYKKTGGRCAVVCGWEWRGITWGRWVLVGDKKAVTSKEGTSTSAADRYIRHVLYQGAATGTEFFFLILLGLGA